MILNQLMEAHWDGKKSHLVNIYKYAKICPH